jgi:DNA polymerase alpha-associated DNA helicase A
MIQPQAGELGDFRSVRPFLCQVEVAKRRCSMDRTFAHLQRIVLPDPTVPTPASHAFNLDLVNVLLGLQTPSWTSHLPLTISALSSEHDDAIPGAGPSASQDVEWLGENLNDSQKEAIRFCLTAEYVACIHGPPGVSSIQTS